ncbi:MAG: toxin-antitoxin system YwqK family antitoxin [Clostridia bacterium]|nr:toxin-antitoxin system YwqK family antitoxin [Clostridia bacterium]
MAKQIISLLFILFFFSASALVAQDTLRAENYKVFYYENGNIASEGLMVDGKPDGYWKTYHENGVLKSEGNRVNFELEGSWKFYDESGKMVLLVNYSAGIKNGLRITWRYDEIVAENFESDIRQGLTTYYYADSAVAKTIPFVNGREEGLAKEYADDGRVITITTYKKGYIVARERINRTDSEGRKQGAWKFFHDNGLVSLEGRYTNDEKDGYFKSYDKNGKLLQTSKWVNGVQQENVAELAQLEVARDYYPNGQVAIVQTYKNGVLQGVRRQYDEQGNLVSGAYYENGVKTGSGITLNNGVRDGAWEEFYPDGSLRAAGIYSAGLKTGKWNYYHANGKLEQTGVYNSKGTPEGLWMWYYPSGALLREENFLHGLPDGMFTEFYEDGSIVIEGEYIEGEEEAHWVYYYGDSREEGSYSYGRRNGVWKYFDAEGNLLFEGEFIDDNPHGKHTYYWASGQVKDEINYVAGMKQGDWKKYNSDGTLLLVITYQNGIERKYDGITIKPAFTESFDDVNDDGDGN